MPARCAIWARVSTEEQESGNQLPELRQWAARRGLQVAAEYIVDGASAWKGEHHAQLAAALAGARLGRYDVLLVWALDRLDREGVESTLGVLRRFHEAGAPVWSLKEAWTETADPRLAELLGAIYAWMAAEESRRRSERVRAGLARRKAEGKPVGRRAGSRDRKPRKRSGYYARWGTRTDTGVMTSCDTALRALAGQGAPGAGGELITVDIDATIFHFTKLVDIGHILWYILAVSLPLKRTS